MFQSRTILKFIIPLLILGALIFFSGTAPVNFLKNLAWRILKPVAGLVMNTSDRISGGAGEENGRLAAALFEIEELRLRMAELEKALAFKEAERLPLSGARVILYVNELGREYLIVDRGRKEGVSEGSLVLGPDQTVLGRIRKVEDSFSKVSLASNPGETFEAEILPLRIPALAKGLGARTFSLELIPQDAPLKRGDLVALSGGRTFLLGEVSREESSATAAFKEAGAVFMVNPKLFKDVFILQSLR